jgi:hypothetical protein
LVDAARRFLDGHVLIEAEADGDRGELALVVDHERGKPLVDLGHGGEWNLGVVGAAHIDTVEIDRIALI